MKIDSNAHKVIRGHFTPEELAQYLAVSRATVYRLVARRQLPFCKIAGVLRFKKEDIERHLDECRVEPIKM